MEEQHQMPCWYYEREDLIHTPSYHDQIDTETEMRYRREGARFLFDVSNKLKLRYDTCATAIVFFHRFYMSHSFKAFPRYVTAACCLMLAGKVEETPKKVRDIIKTAQFFLSDADFKQFGNDPKEEVMAYERVLLKTIKFDLQVSHPYGYLLQFVKRIKGNNDKLKELVQMSWSFINDSLATTLCLQWEPEIVACATLYLATRVSRYTIEDWEGKQPGVRWWESFVEGMSTEVMEDICHKILDLYPNDTSGPTDVAGTSSSSVTKHSNHNASVNSSSSIRNHPSFHTAASAANTVASEPMLKRPRIGSTQDVSHIGPNSSQPTPHMVPGLQTSFQGSSQVISRGFRHGA